MEIWFWLAIVSSAFSGLHIFIQKVGSTRLYNSNLLNAYSSGISAIIGFILAGFIEGYGELSVLMIGVGLLSGLIYIFSAGLRMDSMRYIDTTILLPLHKFVSPLFALVFGLVYFGEVLTTKEWIGIIVGISVPLLLITRAEHKRQKNLSKGLLLMLVSAVLAALAVVVNKEGVHLFSAVLLFAAFANAFTAIFGILFYRFRRRPQIQDPLADAGAFDISLLKLSVVSGFVQIISFVTLLLAFSYGGQLGIVYTIHSLYILIPIILAIWFYNEHWNLQKVIAIVLSVAALGLLG
jgi:drug/metabolite transporter (DMT)-like permease